MKIVVVSGPGGGMADAMVSKTIEVTLVWVRLPPRAFLKIEQAHVAQSVEHILGKNEVNSSILFMGFTSILILNIPLKLINFIPISILTGLYVWYDKQVA